MFLSVPRSAAGMKKAVSHLTAFWYLQCYLQTIICQYSSSLKKKSSLVG